MKNAKPKNKKSSRSTTTVNTPELISLLTARGISQRELAKALRVDPAAIHHLLHGKRKLRLDEVPAMADILSITPEEVLEHFGINLGVTTLSPSMKGVKVEGWLDGTLTLHLEGLRGKKEIPSPFPDKDIRAVRAQTAGSEFYALDGALFFFRYSKLKGPDPDCLSKMCLVKVEGDERLKLRVLKRSYVSGRFDLCSMAGRVMEENVRVDATHPIVWMKV